MNITEALWVLDRAHTRDDAQVGYTVEMMPNLFGDIGRSEYIEAWGVVRAHLRSDRGWQPMDTAPKTNPEATGAEPSIRILLRFGEEAVAVAYWDWAYADGGYYCRDGFAWIGPECGEPLNLHYSAAPDGWMELPLP